MISNSMSTKQASVPKLGMAGVNFNTIELILVTPSIKRHIQKHTSTAEAVNDEELCKQRLNIKW